jgi:hypothetical protein
VYSINYEAIKNEKLLMPKLPQKPIATLSDVCDAATPVFQKQTNPVCVTEQRAFWCCLQWELHQQK